MPYYISFQYSAIQKTIERHSRLWSLAGISQQLSQMNEIEMPNVVSQLKGTVLVAGGGKFTAKFDDEKKAKEAIKKIKKMISTTLPMLEFQYSPNPVLAGSLNEAKERGLLEILNRQKSQFRGYGLEYSPYFLPCEECGEYPADDIRYRTLEDGSLEKYRLCRICQQALSSSLKYANSSDDLSGDSSNNKKTSIQQVYTKYLEILGYKNQEKVEIPREFEKLFRGQKDSKNEKDREEKGRLAVWFSDVNDMNSKVPIWLNQDEDLIPKIFKTLKDINIEIIAQALSKVFPQERWLKHEGKRCLPFRLIVAGGDDLCIVFAEEYIISFVLALSEAYRNITEELSGKKESNSVYRYLSLNWLKEQAEEYNRKHNRQGRLPGPYSFGGAFVVTHVHTPFSAVHALGETLMKKAKNESDRRANSVNWRILGLDEEVTTETLIPFEKPLLIDPPSVDIDDIPISRRLTFRDYERLCRFYRKILTKSQIRRIAEVLLDSCGDGRRAEKELIRYADVGTQKGLQYILADKEFREGGTLDGSLLLDRIATLLELMILKTPD